MARRKEGEHVTAKFLQSTLNSKPVLEFTRFCLRIAKELGRESGFEVTAQFRGSIIGLSPICFGKAENVPFHDYVVRDLDTFWHVRQRRLAGKPRTSQFVLATIHAVPVSRKDGFIFLPSLGDLDILRYDRARVKIDHGVVVHSLCIELRRYRDATRFFVVQERVAHSKQSLKRASKQVTRVHHRYRNCHRSPVIKAMQDQGYCLAYGTFGRCGFAIDEATLTRFEFDLPQYRGR